MADFSLKQGLALTLRKPHAGLVVIQEFNTGLLKYRDDSPKRIGARTHRPVEAFHALHRAQRDLALGRQFLLRPAE